MTSSVGTLTEEAGPSFVQSSTIAQSSNSTARWPQSVREFECLVDACQDELVRYAFCRLRNRADAEDVVQDVLIRAYVDRERHASVPVGPYLYRMVANRCIDVLRKRTRTESLTDKHPVASEAEGDVAGKLECIEALISELPARQAEVMRLRVFSEMPFQSIADTLGVSLPTIKSRFRYGIRRLRNILSQER